MMVGISTTNIQTPQFPTRQRAASPPANIPTSIGGGPSLPSLGQAAAPPSEKQGKWRAFVERLATDEDLQRAMMTAASEIVKPGEGSDFSRIVQGANAGVQQMGQLGADRRTEARQERQLAQTDTRIAQTDTQIGQEDTRIEQAGDRHAETVRRNQALEDLQGQAQATRNANAATSAARVEIDREISTAQIENLQARAALAREQATSLNDPQARTTIGGAQAAAQALTAARMAIDPSLNENQVFIEEMRRQGEAKKARKLPSEYRLDVLREYAPIMAISKPEDIPAIEQTVQSLVEAYEADLESLQPDPVVPPAGSPAPVVPPPAAAVSPAPTALDPQSPVIYQMQDGTQVTLQMVETLARQDGVTVQEIMQRLAAEDQQGVQ